MRSALAAGALALAVAPILTAAYSKLVVNADGKTIYFSAPAGIYTGSLNATAAVNLSLHVRNDLEDVSADGLTTATSHSASGRYCGFSGSSCWLAPACTATFTIKGPLGATTNPYRPAFIRLDRAGRFAWIEGAAAYGACNPLGSSAPAVAPGLHEVPSFDLVAPAAGGILANRRTGRRLVTSAGRALTFIGPQLHWIDAQGAHQIRHVFGAAEAVTDARGEHVVYVDTAGGFLHWIDHGNDEELGFAGSAPALSDDGGTLVFLSADNRLTAYDRTRRSLRQLTNETCLEFTLGSDAAFAVSTGNRIVRVELSTGAVATVLEPYPEITAFITPFYPGASPIMCPYICYGELPPGQILGRGMMLVLQGSNLDRPGWRVRSGSAEMTIHPVSATEAWVQIPSDLAQTDRTALIYNPAHPVQIEFRAFAVDRVAACLGAVHQDFSRVVTQSDPAIIGEYIHLFLTGLQGIETIPDGIPNPLDHLVPIVAAPALADPASWQPTFFGLAPGLIGLQQLDLRITGKSASQRLFDGTVQESNCAPIPTASQ